MEFDTGPRYSQDAALAYGSHYYYHNRNIPLAVTHIPKGNLRGFPIGGPVGGSRNRPTMNQEDGNVEGGQARRRIAVACARCRKRKIRCSGDPGNGTGCSSCKQAGVADGVCQFHRVGSNEVSTVIDEMNFAQHIHVIGNNGTAAIQVYEDPGELVYPRSSYPQLERPVYPSGWAVPYPENPAPVDACCLDHSSAYLANAQTVTAANAYSNHYRWPPSSRPASSNAYLEPDPIAAFNTQSTPLPYISTNLRNPAPPEGLSPLNMTSLQVSLPDRTLPGRQASESNAPQRQLPIPLPSPAQATRNIVDQMQDRRLRSVQGAPGPLSSVMGLPKPALLAEEIPSTSVADSSVSCPTGRAISYMSVSAGDMPSTSIEAQPHINFNTSNLLDGMPASAVPTTYSNFRSYNLPTSSPGDGKPNTTRHGSPTSLYSYGANDSSRRRGGDTANDGALMNGHGYAPMDPGQPHRTSLENSQRDSHGSRSATIERGATNSNRPF